MTTYVDTNVLLRLLLNDHPAQRAHGVKALEAAPIGTVVVLDPVLVETVFQLESPRSFGLDRVDHLPHLISLLQTECFALNSTTWDALSLLGHNPKLDYTDCILIAISRTKEADAVLSFDRELNRVASAE